MDFSIVRALLACNLGYSHLESHSEGNERKCSWFLFLLANL